jgi:predicted small integral membrane protein
VQRNKRIDKGNDSEAGFLPIKTNAFDRIFIAVVVFVAIHLLWMRFLEVHIPLFAATILSAMIGALIVMRG